jgi:uncharacterized protein YodC (DUF2158 family)
MISRLKIGDVVLLRSGGQRMTVIDLPNDEDEGVVVVWHDVGGRPRIRGYPEEALAVVETLQ